MPVPAQSLAWVDPDIFATAAHMVAGEKISKLGFKRWYERQLVECHAYLVTCFLGIIVVATSFEVFSLHPPVMRFVFRTALISAGVLVSLLSWCRYRDMMLLAERLGDVATCGKCGTYAAFNVLAFGPRPLRAAIEGAAHPALDAETWLKVKCRKCGNEWQM